MKNICPICNSENLNIIRNYNSESKLLRESKLTKCINCSLVFVNPMPDFNLWIQYNNDYFNVAHGGISTDKNTINFFKGIAVVRMKYILEYLKKYSITINSILEIGPGVGYLAEKFLNLHPGIKYSVIESDNSCFPTLSKLGIKFYNNIDQLPDNSSFDLVIFSHVLEHVINPNDFLQSNTKYLKKGGILFIDVPCNDWKFKTSDEPHLLFFDKKPLFHLLNYNLNQHEIQLSYHGVEINKIDSMNNYHLLNKLFNKIRVKSFFLFLSWILLKDKKYLNFNEYKMIYNFKPHLTNENESWWLRAISIK